MNGVPRSLRRLCHLVRGGCVLGALLTVAGPAWLWTSPERIARLGPLVADLGCQAVAVDERTAGLGLAVSLPLMALGLYLLRQLWTLFGEFAAGRALTPQAQQALQRWAVAWLALAVVQPVFRAAFSVVLTLARPPGQRQLVLGISGDDYLEILLGLAMLAIATVMRQAVRAAEENRAFV